MCLLILTCTLLVCRVWAVSWLFLQPKFCSAFIADFSQQCQAWHIGASCHMCSHVFSEDDLRTTIGAHGWPILTIIRMVLAFTQFCYLRATVVPEEASRFQVSQLFVDIVPYRIRTGRCSTCWAGLLLEDPQPQTHVTEQMLANGLSWICQQIQTDRAAQVICFPIGVDKSVEDGCPVIRKKPLIV